MIYEVPDSAKQVRIEGKRHTTLKPTNWTSADDYFTWSLEQWREDRWFELGSSTTYGGVIEENGVEQELSFDETPLVAGTGRKIRVLTHSHTNKVDTEVSVSFL